MDTSLFTRVYTKYFKNKVDDHEFELEENKNKGNNRVSEYLTGNASMGTNPVAFSLLASFFSTTSVLDYPADVYSYGMQVWVISLGVATTTLIAAFITGPFFDNLKIKSIFEYIEKRYKSKPLRTLGMICYVLRGFVVSSLFVLGPSTVISLMVNMEKSVSIVLMCAIGTFYTCIGGIKAVIWTDVFQAASMFLCLLVIIFKGSYDLGGIGNVWHLNKEGGRLDNIFDFNLNPFLR